MILHHYESWFSSDICCCNQDLFRKTDCFLKSLCASVFSNAIMFRDYCQFRYDFVSMDSLPCFVVSHTKSRFFFFGISFPWDLSHFINYQKTTSDKSVLGVNCITVVGFFSCKRRFPIKLFLQQRTWLLMNETRSGPRHPFDALRVYLFNPFGFSQAFHTNVQRDDNDAERTC